jgi:hypothetical protein
MANFLSIRPLIGNRRRVRFFFALSIVVISGCAVYSSDRLEDFFGPAAPRERIESVYSAPGNTYVTQVQPLLEKRCVVCHGCYDAPCQLNMTAPEGIDRGASKNKVYSGSRLTAAPLTRLFEDAQSTAAWRAKKFYPVLNERQQSSQANLQASVLYHMLELKRANPLPEGAILDDSFTLGLDRKQQCPKPSEIDRFMDERPLWGMPYALPGLSEGEFNILESWLKKGANMALPKPLGAATQGAVERWETFLNGQSLKEQLMSRYLYEHWFLAHLYFKDLGDDEFFRIVRSSTPPGESIELIPTRRPYDDPGVARVYYRLWRDHTTRLDKTHLPYPLNAQRMALYTKLFLGDDYELESLPSYDPSVAANPFIAFSAIPVDNRWRFLLLEAQFTVMNFIKGPVCRGQVALNVIRDHFWVFFANPEYEEPMEANAFFIEQESNLRIPVQAGSSAAPLATWYKYSKSQEAYLRAKSDDMNENFPNGEHLTLNIIWDGDGHNPNAALTIFRHFDSASVVKGLVGGEPETAWVIDYAVLERIHYLLVAGFDVFGNLGHQLTTRLYMDFLRMESEFNFLALLPPQDRLAQRQRWYEGASERQKSYLFGSRADFNQPSGIRYHTDDPKAELFGMLQQKLEPVLNTSYSLDHFSVPASHRDSLQVLTSYRGRPVSVLPQLVFINVTSQVGNEHYYTLLHNNAHSNITSLFMESSQRLPSQDSITIVRGFIGSYPSAFWHVREQELPELVAEIGQLSDEASYRALMDRYGVRRTTADFWQHSDKIMAAHLQANPLENGLLDYNRLENR